MDGASRSFESERFQLGKGEARASQVIERDGKFYWYVTVEHKTIPGKSIGVAVSDSPVSVLQSLIICWVSNG